MSIIIANRQRTKKINTRLLRQIILSLLEELEIGRAEVEINLVNAEEMTRVNETFLNHSGSTDVITFDYTEKTQPSNYSGELFVCVDEAVIQSRQFKTKWRSEVLRYIVHGLLHLLGHDDHRVASRRKMKREENRRLRNLSRRFALSKL
jgi:probable rRNA maturation factor